MATWYYSPDGTKQVGPIDDASMAIAIRNGVIKPEHLVFKIGGDEWKRVVDFPELAPPADDKSPFENESPFEDAATAASAMAGAESRDEYPWTVRVVQSENNTWAAEITFVDATDAEMQAIQELAGMYIDITFGGLPRIFAGERSNQLLFNLANLATVPEPALSGSPASDEVVLALRDDLVHTAKILHANRLGYWAFDERLAWRVPEGFKLVPPFWLPAFAARRGKYPNTAPEWSDGPNVQPLADVYVIACACFLAATGQNFDPSQNLLPGAVHPPAASLDGVLAPALQEKPSRRPEDPAAWRALWDEHRSEKDKKEEEEVPDSGDETISLPSGPTAAMARAGVATGTAVRKGPVARGGTSIRSRRTGAVASVAAKRGRGKGRGKADTARAERFAYQKDIVPLDRDSLARLRTNPLFWLIMLLAMLPLLINAAGDNLLRAYVLLAFFAVFWGGIVRNHFLRADGDLKMPLAAFCFSGIVGVVGLHALYGVLPDFLLRLPTGDPLWRLPGSLLLPGLAESVTTLLPVVAYLAARRDDAQPETAIEIGVASGLGFATLKNPLYHAVVAPLLGDVAARHRHGMAGIGEGLLENAGGATIGALLFLLSLIFAQALWAGIAAHFAALAAADRARLPVFGLLAVALPAALHGLYNWLSDAQEAAGALIIAASLLAFYGYVAKTRARTAARHTQSADTALVPREE